jgi:PTH1 family peptidyl-tRNA hydrolase
VGFLFVDYLQAYFRFPEFKDSRWKGVISEGIIGAERVILLKPLTYMNLTGESLAPLAAFYKLDVVHDIVVIMDDIDMEFGKVRFRSEGSSGGHNGIRSIITNIGTEKFQRLKIGIGRDSQAAAADWVLSSFSQAELESLKTTIFPEAHRIFVERVAWMK